MGRQPQGRFCTFRSFRAGDSDGCCRNDLIHGPIADNLSAHKTTRVKEFLHLHPNVKLHFTPTYSSWLNQVELWLSKIERDLIARGIFTSTDDLSRKLLPLHPPVQQNGSTDQMEIHRRLTTDSCTTSHRYSPLVLAKGCHPSPNNPRVLAKGESG